MKSQDAIGIAFRLAAIRSYFAVVTIDHAFRWRTAEDLEAPSALKGLAQSMPAVEVSWPKNRDAAVELQERVIKNVIASMPSGALEESIVGLCLTFIDVTAVACMVDVLDLIVVTEGPKPPFPDQLAEKRSELEAASATFGRAIERVAEALDGAEVSPAVGDAVATLRGAFESPYMASYIVTGRVRSSWRRDIREGMRKIYVALEIPAEPRKDATASIVSPGEVAREAALLQEIFEDPYDDLRRLRWAEVIETRDAPRDALVHAQVTKRKERRRAPSSSCSDSEAATILVSQHPEWADDVRRLGATSVTFHGGFVEAVTIRADVFLRNAEELLRTAPIRRLRLTGVAQHLDALLASGWLERMLWLDLSGEALTDAHVMRLTQARRLTALRALSLEKNRITDAGVRALWASPTFASLVYCGLAGNPCTNLACRELTHQEMSYYEWELSEFGCELNNAFGRRRWAVPSDGDWPPNLDVLEPAPPQPRTLRDAYGDYLRAGATPAAASVLSPAFANGPLADVSALLAQFAKGGAGLYEAEGGAIHVGAFPPKKVPIDSRWFDTVELTTSVFLPSGNDGSWFALHPVRRFHFAGFLDTAEIERVGPKGLSTSRILGEPYAAGAAELEPVRSLAFAEVGLYLYWTGKLFASFYEWQTAKERLGLEPIDAEWEGPGRDMEYGKIVRPDTLALEGVLDDDDMPKYLTEALTGDARVLFPRCEIVPGATFRTVVHEVYGLLLSDFPHEQRMGVIVRRRFQREPPRA